MSLAWLGAAIALLVAMPIAVDRWGARRASPAQLVTLAMVRLVGLVLVPLAVTACVTETLDDHSRHGMRLALFAAAVAVAALTVGRACRAAYLAERHWRTITSALIAAGGRVGDEVTVVPLETAAAFAAGDRVVVSAALIQALEPREVDAVLAHERAHVRGGHPRIAAWARALCRGAFDVSPARSAEARIRQQLELLADRDAVATVRDPAPVHAAVTKLSVLHPTDAVLAPHTTDFTAERLDCLALPRPVSARADSVVATATAVLAAIAVVIVCGAFHVRLVGVGMVVCGLAALGVASILRPLHRRHA